MHVSAGKATFAIRAGVTACAMAFVASWVSAAERVQKPAATAIIQRDGVPLRITFTDRSGVRLQGFRRVVRSGLSQSQCGVIIAGRQIATLGVGETEVYSCDGLIAAGVVPSAGRVKRIGLIYNASSPNAHFRTAVVLREDGGWHVDPAFAGQFDDTPQARNMAALRRALR